MNIRHCIDTIGNCDGALDKMADTMTDNLAGALALTNSATDDFKLAIGKKLEPYVTRFLRWFSDQVPDATEKVGAWLDNKLPRAVNTTKSALEKIKPPVTFVIKNFSELAIAGGTVVAGLKAFSIAVKVSSFMNKLKGTMTGLTTAQKLATICQTALNTSLLACPVTWICCWNSWNSWNSNGMEKAYGKSRYCQTFWRYNSFG